MMNKIFTFLFYTIFSTICLAQQHKQLSVSAIYHELQKLPVLANVLYVAAHPDDENTRLLSYFANDVKANTAYLSLTRGDGGQNLIGSELRELLGVIRTQELLKARSIDGAIQFFSRANDFGFSKEPTETLSIWDTEKVKEDLSYVIRTFRPDIIINRFNHRTPRTTHGHHTASAMLTVDCFDDFGQETFFPNQAKNVGVWQPKRLFFNTSWWFYGGRSQFEKADKSNLTPVNIGLFYNELGKSNQEIASLSRSQHQSQGFGSASQRGDEIEYLEIIKGSKPQNNNVFDGIDISWNRVKNGGVIGEYIDNIIKNFDHKHPEKSVNHLVEAYQMINQIDDDYWKHQKQNTIKNIIHQILGLVVEATTNEPYANKNQNVNLKIELINRSSVNVKLLDAIVFTKKIDDLSNLTLQKNQPIYTSSEITIPNQIQYSSPHWLENDYTEGMYQVDEDLAVLPNRETSLQFEYTIQINGINFQYKTPIAYKYTDRVKGELYQPFNIIPKVSLEWNESVNIFSNKESKIIRAKVVSNQDDLSGTLKLNYNKNDWKVTPETIEINKLAKNSSREVIVNVEPLTDFSSDYPELIFIDKHNNSFNQTVQRISYEHIPHQYVLKKASTQWKKTDIKIGNEKIAYIMGAGDDVPSGLKNLGYNVEIVNIEELNQQNIQQYDVFITGIRAYNTSRALVDKQQLLLEEVKKGKKMIVQYNTMDVLTKEIGPYPLKISRERVTEEDAKVTFLNPQHPVMTQPNVLTHEDFEGWVQERGLYFPNEWPNQYIPIFASNDNDEKSSEGMLLIAPHGNGYFIYTGISFFRQLPAGVLGSYKLLSNLISF